MRRSDSLAAGSGRLGVRQLVTRHIFRKDGLMELELQVSARNLPLAEDIQAMIRREAAKLETFYPRIMGCRVLVEAGHRFASGEPVEYVVRVDLTVPQGELPTTKQGDAVLWTAVQMAFAAARRQLQDFARIQRGDTGDRRPGARRRAAAAMTRPHRGD